MTVLIGSRFGRLIISKEFSVINEHLRRINMLTCLCDCGTIKDINKVSVTSSRTKSCGCLSKEKLSARRKVHGDREKREYGIWQHIKARCFNPNHRGYKDYGGRGITMCDRWKNSYLDFISDIGYSPSPRHSVDRVRNEGNYEPSNCIWRTQKEQANNTRGNVFIEHEGIVLSKSMWSDKIGISRAQMDYHYRVKKLSISQIFLKVTNGEMKTFNIQDEACLLGSYKESYSRQEAARVVKQVAIDFLKWRQNKKGNPQDGTVWWLGLTEEQQFELYLKSKQ